MKKTFTLFFELVFLNILFGSVTSYASDDNSIYPYQEIMDKLNKELGSTFHVKEEKREFFYNNVKDITPSAFEELLRKQYKEFTESLNVDMGPGNEISQETIIKPYYVSEDITQYASLSYNSSMYLSSNVFSFTGGSGTFKYNSIYSYGTTWPSGFTGFHWEVDSKSARLSSDEKSCTVTLRGHPEDANGVALALSLTASNTFYVN